jgi:hypothetical protein
VLILGTALSFVQLLADLRRFGLTLQFDTGSRVMETGGYKGRHQGLPKEQLYRELGLAFGIGPDSIISEYGMSELSSQAYDQSSGRIQGQSQRLFRFPPWARWQAISPENGQAVADGQPGLLRVFDLANVFSTLAIQTEDLAVRRGDGFELLGRAATAEPRGCSLMPMGGDLFRV